MGVVGADWQLLLDEWMTRPSLPQGLSTKALATPLNGKQQRRELGPPEEKQSCSQRPLHS